MAVITATNIVPAGANSVTVTTLGASDTLTFNPGRDPVLILNNVTAGGLTPNIDGDGGTAVSTDSLGTVDVSSGLTLSSIGAGATVAIRLKSISAYLTGTVTITGGDGIEATLLEF